MKNEKRIKYIHSHPDIYLYIYIHIYIKREKDSHAADERKFNINFLRTIHRYFFS